MTTPSAAAAVLVPADSGSQFQGFLIGKIAVVAVIAVVVRIVQKRKGK